MREFLPSKCRPGRPRAAFTLVELLTVVAIIAILAGILIPVVGQVRQKAQQADSTSRLRSLGSAALLYASEHDGSWPRSTHAYSREEPQWWLALAPYLGSDVSLASDPRVQDLLNGVLRDPLDVEETAAGQSNRFSYGFNVHLQLGELDDYVGKPQRWQKVYSVPFPASTVMFASNRLETSDHFMAHDWATTADAEHDLDPRLDDRASFVYCDGHVEWLAAAETFNPGNGVNHWNPSLAGAK